MEFTPQTSPPSEPPPFKHRRVEAEIRRLVLTLPVGARLPAERSLAQSQGCNFLTVRRALKALVDDGTVVRRVGSGTFVARHPATEAASASSGERIGVLAWKNSGAYAYRVLEGIAHGSLVEQVELRSGWTADFAGQGLEQARAMKNEGCTSLILPWFPHERAAEVREFLRASPLPAALPMVIPGHEKNCFEDQAIFGRSLQTASEQLCEYFYQLGARRIAWVGPDVADDVVMQRLLSAYVCYTSRLGLPNFCGLVRPGGAAMDRLAERWREHRGDLAVVCYDDEHALRFMTAMHKIGLNAPADYRIVGYNDTEASAFSDPPLSTIRQNFDYIGLWLIKNARALARGEVCQSSMMPRVNLLVRETCGGAACIDAAFRGRMPALDLTVVAPLEEPAAAAGGELAE